MLIKQAQTGVNPQNPQNPNLEDEASRQALDRVLMSDMSARAKLIALARLRGATSEEIYTSVLNCAPEVSDE